MKINDYCVFSIEVAGLKTEATINMINPCRRLFSLQTSLSHPIPITLTRVLSRLHAGSHSTNTVRCPTVGEEGLPWYTLPEQAQETRASLCAQVCTGHLRSLELWDAEDGLHHGAEIAAVAQVLEPCVPWAVHGLQLRPRLLDHLPLADPWLDVVVLEPVLCLGQDQ